MAIIRTEAGKIEICIRPYRIEADDPMSVLYLSEVVVVGTKSQRLLWQALTITSRDISRLRDELHAVFRGEKQATIIRNLDEDLEFALDRVESGNLYLSVWIGDAHTVAKGFRARVSKDALLNFLDDLNRDLDMVQPEAHLP